MVISIAILFIILGAFLTLVLHEMSHVLIAKLAGYKIEAITLIPRYHEGEVIFGSVRFRGNDKSITPWMYLIPFVKATLFFLLWYFLSKSFIYLAFFAVWEIMDGVNWLTGLITQIPSTDGYKFRECLRSKDIDIS